MILLYPRALLLLILVAVGAVIGWRLRPGPGVATRAVLLALLSLALAQPSLQLPASPRTVVYLVDASASVPDSERARALSEISDARSGLSDEDQSIVLHFGDTARAEPGAPSPHTDLGGALRGALQHIPPSRIGEVVVYTDGRNTGAPTDAPLAEAAARGVSVRSVALDPSGGPAAPGWLEISGDAAPGETVSASLVVHGGAAGFTGELSLHVGDTAQAQQPLALAAGERATLDMPLPLPPDLDSGLVAVEARMGDEVLVGHVLIRRPPSVLLLGDRRGDTRPLERLLAAEGMRVSVLPPQRAPADLSEHDVVVLADTPVRPPEGGGPVLAPGFLSALEDYVRAGGGLLVLGGERSYDLGGWEDSLLEPLLPVKLDPDGATKDDAVTLVIALDKSGSMARPAVPVQYATGLGRTVSAQLSGGRPIGSKIRLADEGAIAAMDLLREKDRLGVLTIDSVARWAVPIQLVDDRAPITQRILRISAGGGGINLMTALDASYAALKAVDTPIRHAILFADSAGISERRRGDETALALVQRYRSADITLSVVGIGGPKSRDAAYLQELADAGGGQMYLTDDARELPALFTQETERLMGSGLDEEVAIRARAAQWHPALQEVSVASAPALRGANPVLRRPRTRVLLTTDAGAPLLALWRVGLGEVAAAATDAGSRWASRWQRWPGYARLWTQLVRHLAAPDDTSEAVLTIAADGPRAQATLTMRRPDGMSADVSGVTLSATDSRGETTALDTTVTEPGTWAATLAPQPGSLWTISAEDGRGERIAAATWAAPPSAEGRHRSPDPAVLAALDQPAQSSASTRESHPLAPWLLGLVCLLLPLDAFARGRRARR